MIDQETLTYAALRFGSTAAFESLVEHCAPLYEGPMFALRRIAFEPSHPMFSSLEQLLAMMPPEMLVSIRDEPLFVERWEGHSEEQREHEARLQLAGRIIEEALVVRRLDALRKPGGPRPAPYDHPALHEIEVDQNSLVPLLLFDVDHAALRKGDAVFHVFPSLPSLQSMYWTTLVLADLRRTVAVDVRLDPLMVLPADEYQPNVMLMRVYGVYLDWEQIGALHEDIHAQAMSCPDRHGHVRFTDFLWSPRWNEEKQRQEVHFQCEELPHEGEFSARGSRYLHAIYLPESRTFDHVDGAIRLFTAEELARRNQTHIRKAGKVGQRFKLFRANGSLSATEWGQVTAAFFVWNDDVVQYLQGADTNVPPRTQGV